MALNAWCEAMPSARSSLVSRTVRVAVVDEGLKRVLDDRFAHRFGALDGAFQEQPVPERERLLGQLFLGHR